MLSETNRSISRTFFLGLASPGRSGQRGDEPAGLRPPGVSAANNLRFMSQPFGDGFSGVVNRGCRGVGTPRRHFFKSHGQTCISLGALPASADAGSVLEQAGFRRAGRISRWTCFKLGPIMVCVDAEAQS